MVVTTWRPILKNRGPVSFCRCQRMLFSGMRTMAAASAMVMQVGVLAVRQGHRGDA